jgi:hypothetical protein
MSNGFFAQTLEHFTKLPKDTYTRPEEADVTSLLNSICNFDFVVTIVIVQMCLAFKKGLSRSLRSYISFFWSGVCVFWQFCKMLKGLSKKYNLMVYFYF